MKRTYLPETPVAGKPLGRHVLHDPRSLRYLQPVRDDVLVSVRHTRHIPVLDQGALGSCTGNASIGAVGTSPLYETLPAGTGLDEDAAVAVYSAATRIDDYYGTYKPTDTGSSGLAVAKVLKSLGLISGYRHCTSLAAVLTALQDGPVIAGTAWHDSFDEPDADGVIALTERSLPRGGHEYVLDEVDVRRHLIGLTNSWGESYGLDGRAYISWDDFATLLADDGDVTVLVPVDRPAPEPSPPADVEQVIKQTLTLIESFLRQLLKRIKT